MNLSFFIMLFAFGCIDLFKGDNPDFWFTLSAIFLAGCLVEVSVLSKLDRIERKL